MAVDFWRIITMNCIPLKESTVSKRRTSRRRSAKKQSKQPHDQLDAEDQPMGGKMARTRRLVMAAVRVWELKQRAR